MSLLIAMFPAISLVTPLFNIERNLGLFDTWLGLIIPYITFGAAAGHLHAVGLLPGDPVGAGEGGQDGRRHARSRRSRKVIAPLAAPGMFTTAILVFIFCWNDFLFAISLTSTTRARTVPAAIGFFTGSSQFESPDRLDRRRLGDHHHPDHRVRPVLPTPDRRRAHVRRRQGLGARHGRHRARPRHQALPRRRRSPSTTSTSTSPTASS